MREPILTPSWLLSEIKVFLLSSKGPLPCKTPAFSGDKTPQYLHSTSPLSKWRRHASTPWKRLQGRGGNDARQRESKSKTTGGSFTVYACALHLSAGPTLLVAVESCWRWNFENWSCNACAVRPGPWHGSRSVISRCCDGLWSTDMIRLSEIAKCSDCVQECKPNNLCQGPSSTLL